MPQYNCEHAACNLQESGPAAAAGLVQDHSKPTAINMVLVMQLKPLFSQAFSLPRLSSEGGMLLVQQAEFRDDRWSHGETSFVETVAEGRSYAIAI